MNKRVAAVTVTFNRTCTLKKCIEALKNQTIPPDAIILVDNHSREEEQLVLRELAAADPRIHLHVLPENMGGAGGFQAGMEYARSLSPDYYWLMDDDAYPDPDCLETLLSYGEMLPDTGGLCPVNFGIDLSDYQYFQHQRVTAFLLHPRPVTRDIRSMPPYLSEDANAFVGPLFPAAAVEEAGLPDGSLFIYGDDMDYTYRISRKHRLYLIRDALIRHQDPPTRDVNMRPEGFWKEYYANRNRFFLMRRFHKCMPVRLAAYLCYIVRLILIIFKSRLKGYSTLRDRMILKAIRDGLGNRRGKTLDPREYLRSLQDSAGAVPEKTP